MDAWSQLVRKTLLVTPWESNGGSEEFDGVHGMVVQEWKGAMMGRTCQGMRAAATGMKEAV